VLCPEKCAKVVEAAQEKCVGSAQEKCAKVMEAAQEKCAKAREAAQEKARVYQSKWVESISERSFNRHGVRERLVGYFQQQGVKKLQKVSDACRSRLCTCNITLAIYRSIQPGQADQIA
jgi:hypothetical protein